MQLAHRVCLVTAASTLVGRAVCRRLARQGAHVVATDPAGDDVETLVSEFGGIAFRSDLRKPRDATALVAQVEQRVGPIDLICWNPEIGEQGGFELPDAAWQHELSGSLLAYLGLTRLIVPDMLRRGQGYLVSIAGWEAWRVSSCVPATVAVTGDAVAAFTRWLGTAYGERGLRTLALMPDSSRSDALAGQPVERHVDPDGIAALLLARLQQLSAPADHPSPTTTEHTPS